MAVKRIVPNIAASHLESAKAFYGGILGMDVAMDLGWIMTFGTETATTPQVSIAKEGGSGTPVPEPSIEVDNFDAIHQRVVQAGKTG
jgi:catechol 2,3-dioxygenase-like lactoylglutathione lyase family enzyme